VARHLRVEYPGAVYHVMARGNDRTTIFRTVEDRRHFLDLLTESLDRYEVQLYAWVLMDTHYHLALRTEQPNLSALMHYLNTAYTVWMNLRNRRRGHLFEGRYKAIVMEEEGYLLSVTGYLHMNPVRVRGWECRSVDERMEQVTGYPWSSYSAYTRAHPKVTVPPVSCQRAWGELGAKTERGGRQRYRHYVRDWLLREAEERKKPVRARDLSGLNPFSETKMGCYLGGDEFRDLIQGLLSKDRELSDEIVNYRQWRRTVPMAALLEKAAGAWGVSVGLVHERRRPNEARDTVIYLCREAGQKGLREIGEVLGIRSAAVGHAIRRVKRRAGKDRRMQRAVHAAKGRLIRLIET